MGIGDKLKALIPGRRRARSGDDEAEDDLDDLAAEDDAPPPENAGDDGTGDDAEDPGEDDNDNDADDAEDGGRRRRLVRLALGAVAGLVLLAGAGGGVWYFLADHGDANGAAATAATSHPASPVADDGVPRVILDIPPRRSAFGALADGAAPSPVETARAAAGLTPSPPAGKPVETLMAPTPPPAPPPTPVAAPAAPQAGQAGQAPPAPPPAPRDGPKTLNEISAATEGPGAGILVAAARAAAFTSLPQRPGAKALAPAPDPALLEPGKAGPLPKIAGDGRAAWKTYAAPAPATAGKAVPRVAVLVEGLGISRIVTDAAVERLPGPISLAFSAYGGDLGTWTRRAREAGHETFLSLPLEPDRYPERDPGPLALLTSATAADNAGRLDVLLAKAVGYVGVAPVMGERFMSALHQVRPMFETLKTRGLMFVDAVPDPRSVAEKVSQEATLPLVRADLRLDDSPSRAFVDARLAELESKAKSDSRALLVAGPYPSVLERIAVWAPGLEARGVTLVPVSAFADGGGRRP